MADIPVKSPCISICLLDEEDICVGCYRSGSEISRWGDHSETEKNDILARTKARRVAAQTIHLS